jgi:hypothetical protein
VFTLHSPYRWQFVLKPMALQTDSDSTEEITELKWVHLNEITELQASHNQAIDGLGKAHHQALETRAEHCFYLREARDIEEQARNIEHLAELPERDQQLERLRRTHLLEVQNKEMVLVGGLQNNDLQNLQLWREKNALILPMRDIKQMGVRKFQLCTNFLMLKHETCMDNLTRQHETFTQDLECQHETSTQDLICPHERSTAEMVCQHQESLYKLKIEAGRLQEQLDAREEQHEFAQVEQVGSRGRLESMCCSFSSFS